MKHMAKYITKRLFGVTNCLFVLFLLIQLIPDKTYRIADHPRYTIILIVFLEAIMLTVSFLVKKQPHQGI